MTCARCEELEIRLAELEEELRPQLRAEQLHALRTRLRLTPTEAKLVLWLYASRRAVTYWQLVDELIQNPDSEHAINALKVLVSKARKKIGFDAITTLHGSGFTLSPVGKALVYQALGKTLEVA